VSVLYSLNLSYYNIISNLDDPVHVFNQTIISQNGITNGCWVSRRQQQCYNGIIGSKYSGNFSYLGENYYTVFTYSEKISLKFSSINEINTYLNQYYKVGKNQTAYINICQINSYYNNLCTDHDQKLSELVQSWLVPPIKEYYDELQTLKYILIGVGCTNCIFLSCGIFGLVLRKKTKPDDN
jgi:hypothetical protein